METPAEDKDETSPDKLMELEKSPPCITALDISVVESEELILSFAALSKRGVLLNEVEK